MEDLKAHWDRVWQTKSHDATSWYQEAAAPSLRFFETAKLSNSAPLIDIGSGASKLIDGWLSQGFRDITALDISAHAFVQSKLRLGAAADHVTFIKANVLDWQPEQRYQLWHDRAVFHFLTDPDSRECYINTLTKALTPRAFFICGAFSTSGPQKCSAFACNSGTGAGELFPIKSSPLHAKTLYSQMGTSLLIPVCTVTVSRLPSVTEVATS